MVLSYMDYEVMPRKHLQEYLATYGMSSFQKATQTT